MISENKIRHMLSVARQCRDIAAKKHMSETMQDACFVMGLLHDIGYEICSDSSDKKDHPAKAKRFLKAFDQYHREISNAIARHGNAYSGLTLFDKILNEADLTVDYQGNIVSVETRLEGIKTHFKDTDPMRYERAVRQAQALFLLNDDASLPSENKSYVYYSPMGKTYEDDTPAEHHMNSTASFAPSPGSKALSFESKPSIITNNESSFAQPQTHMSATSIATSGTLVSDDSCGDNVDL